MGERVHPWADNKIMFDGDLYFLGKWFEDENCNPWYTYDAETDTLRLGDNVVPRGRTWYSHWLAPLEFVKE
jgi:hypothetical protein